MIFNELAFFLLFLAPSVIAFHGAPRWLGAGTGSRVRPWILTGFGMAFFVYFAWKHFGGAWGSAAVLIFVLEMLTSRLYRKGSLWCVAGVFQALTVLSIFKYSHFASTMLADVTTALGIPASPTLPKLLLPLGVSFFTFEFIHVAADVYRGKMERPPLRHYGAFIFFFPTLVAGPIKRYQEFAPQLDQARFEPELFSRGITRILAGLAKKHVLADTFSQWSDKLYGDALMGATPAEISGYVLAYGMKIYFDFSGYSDIAIGCGYLFGIHIPENFDWPYASASISEFWRRWHISLGRWIFDYVYAPLGGSRATTTRTSVNLLVTFAVSGLWHGAAYNFLLWGLWHGACLAIHRCWVKWEGRPSGPLWKPVAVGITLTCVMFGWSLFCMDLSRFGLVVRRVWAGLS